MTIPASLPITSLYAGILGLAFAVQSLRVGTARVSTGKMYGADQGSSLEHRVRSAGTIGEYGFPGVLLLALLEYNSVLPYSWLWLAGLVLTVSRISHSLQLGAPQSYPQPIRLVGFLSTIAFLVLASVALLLGKVKT